VSGCDGPVGMPAELESLILQCLEVDVEKRPKSASALSERLAAIPFPSEWGFERARQWWNLHHPDEGGPYIDEQATASR
jgi:hypothetical protein